MKKTIKGILFDLDGTILNTQRMNIIPLQRLVLEELKIDISYEELLKYSAYPGKKTLELLGFTNVDRSYEKWVEYINNFEEKATLYNGFEDIFKELYHRNIEIGIVSSKTRKQYEIDFLPTGLQKYIKCLVLAEDTINHKPDPEPLLLGAKLLNLAPDHLIYIGDTLSDEVASRKAKMEFGLASWGAFDITNSKPDFLLNSPIEILKLF